MSKIPEKQRALVLQGGGALGAYEVGILKTLFLKLKDEDDEDNPFFDIIAGTSIGAINATILVNYVTNKKKDNPNLAPKECWKGSIEKLEDFWTNILAVPTPSNARLISNGWWWQQNESIENSSIATQEATRRYYSTKQFFATGVNTVFSRPEIIYDTKFFDNFPYSPPNNVWYRYNNIPLRESIESVVGKNFSLKNKPYNSEINDNSTIEGPRHLIVSVDV
jgi:predicted acylesterase/phospholipase RssA